MPLYLCQPGSGHAEPWRYHIQVFAAPFRIDLEDEISPKESDRDLIVANWTEPLESSRTTKRHADAQSHGPVRDDQEQEDGEPDDEDHNEEQDDNDNDDRNEEQESHDASSTGATTTPQGTRTLRSSFRLTLSTNKNNKTNRPRPTPPIRRIRHAEVVLVDDVCISYDRYWLRLRWPGQKGGFAGYIAMGLVAEIRSEAAAAAALASEEEEEDLEEDQLLSVASSGDLPEERGVVDDVDLDDDPTRDETASMRSAEPIDGSHTATSATTAGGRMVYMDAVHCLRTGLAFQTSPALQLMPNNDDGITPPVSITSLPTETVFCRICREGLHEDDDELPSSAAEEPTNNASSSSRGMRSFGGGGMGDTQDSEHEPLPADPLQERSLSSLSTQQQHHYRKGPVQPHPSFVPNTDAMQNPMLAPCECSGSIAFVHYLCVEQWRCRSRHPHAQQGLNCETCRKPYTLPPPTSRPQAQDGFGGGQQVDGVDWLEAMPLHVMNALRHPHVWWRIGAGIVRRRWLRPLAPIFMSPIVALYCRARRLLKKRGVARRRWTCSLCRRRARWKCVRCLRSYYCSRPCQNVSWHIIHKHVCYKPTRFWSSVAVYGALVLFLFPGILRDPVMYDLGACLIPLSFWISSLLGGGFATALKRATATRYDVRGRALELFVAVLTLCLSVVSWGLVEGFFGNPYGCYGVTGGLSVRAEDLSQSRSASAPMPASSAGVLKFMHIVVLKPAQSYYLMFDRLVANSGYWLRTALCMPIIDNGGEGGADTGVAAGRFGATATAAASATETTATCFEHLPHANADFITLEQGGEACASDLRFLVWVYLLAAVSFAGTTLWKRYERQRRRRGRHHAHDD